MEACAVSRVGTAIVLQQRAALLRILLSSPPFLHLKLPSVPAGQALEISKVCVSLPANTVTVPRD